MTNISIPDLSKTAMLVYVSISCWSARKLDKKQTLKTTTDAGATSDGARVNKHLLASADSLLREVQRKANEIRNYVDVNTLPWDDAGNRLVSNDRALVVVGEISQLNEEFNKSVDDFVREYPLLRAQALHNLGDMANDEDYPQPDVVRSKFSMKLSFNPLPTGFGDIRVGMTEAQAQAWQSHFEGNVKTQMNLAIRNAWERLRENLQRYSDRLKLKEDGSGKMEIFRDTMVSSLRETVALLTSLNVFNDPELERVTSKVSREIASFEPDALRNSVATSTLVKSEADALLDHMRAILGD
jgi:hypothetical protein